jgi:hypothetical protein
MWVVIDSLSLTLSLKNNNKKKSLKKKEEYFFIDF